MPYYDLEGEAVVAISVEAASEGEALIKWREFCNDLARSDAMMTHKATQFYARAAGDEPTIVAVEGLEAR